MIQAHVFSIIKSLIGTKGKSDARTEVMCGFSHLSGNRLEIWLSRRREDRVFECEYVLFEPALKRVRDLGKRVQCDRILFTDGVEGL